MSGRRKKRFWSDEEKRTICEQTTVPGVSVAQIGRRYAVNTNLIFNWLKDPRFAPQVVDVTADQAFLPVEIEPAGSPQAVTTERDVSTCRREPIVGKIEIELAGGHCIKTDGDVDPDVLARLLRGILS